MTKQYSLWLTPKRDGVKEKMEGWIRNFVTKRTGGESRSRVFDPHVTLLATFESEGDEDVKAIDVAGKVAEEIKKSVPGKGGITLKCTQGVTLGSSYFQCIYILVDIEPDITKVHEIAKSMLIQERCKLNLFNSEYMPHLSLLYANIDSDVNNLYKEFDKLNPQLASKDVPFTFSATQLELWITDPGDKDMLSWQQLMTFTL